MASHATNIYVTLIQLTRPTHGTQASLDPGNMGPLGEWLPEAIWPRLKSLERIKRFQNIGDAMQSDSDEWQVRETTYEINGQRTVITVHRDYARRQILLLKLRW